MRTFAQKPKPIQQTTSARPTTPGRAHFGQSREVNSILHLQRTIGNQAAQRLLEAEVNAKADATTSEVVGFGHDFSGIPVYSKASVEIQPKLTLNTHGDIYEQEADRLSEQVMRMPPPKLQRNCACGGGCPRCQIEQPGQEHDRVQAKRVESGDLVGTAVPPIVHDILSTPGHALDMATRAFMEPRFGCDFSQVRIHSDAQAGESAHALSALAYTVGTDITFANGQFRPETHMGRQLLAHELTHVVQQGGAATQPSPHPRLTQDSAFSTAEEEARRIATEVEAPLGLESVLSQCGTRGRQPRFIAPTPKQ